MSQSDKDIEQEDNVVFRRSRILAGQGVNYVNTTVGKSPRRLRRRTVPYGLCPTLEDIAVFIHGHRIYHQNIGHRIDTESPPDEFFSGRMMSYTKKNVSVRIFTQIYTMFCRICEVFTPNQ